ncbi:hypothetical protein DD559_01115 [Sphingomonas pokkalii]|uniref:Uncharacterized protein n=2 Tax=Sphingomonas pokkalii TaxID=2175090 RepID=A0A2U0S9S4_9SPHN|nr:hypothetical protein DD559_01115 [Sphingomonas pokkalii]
MGVAAAQQPDTATKKPETSTRGARDPNEMVCVKEEVLGSRLQKRKVCHTRAQWAELRQSDRQNIERVQTGSCQPNGGC